MVRYQVEIRNLINEILNVIILDDVTMLNIFWFCNLLKTMNS